MYIWKIQMHLQIANIMTKGLGKDKYVLLQDKRMEWDLDQAFAPKAHFYNNSTNAHLRGSIMENQLVIW